MSVTLHRYPVDRYLVDSSKNFDMVNISDNDLWNVEPALRPEDDIILRKLQDMLQSTADDLKVLSGELTKFHEPRVQVHTLPTPLDEDFNNKVHIEEVVNAKFHGGRILENPNSKAAHRNDNKTFLKINEKKSVSSNTSDQINKVPVIKNTRKSNLMVTKPKTIEINVPNPESTTKEKEAPKKVQTVSYFEYNYKCEPQPVNLNIKPLNLQHMPSVNIRSELTQQKVFQLDIKPENRSEIEFTNKNNNIAVIEFPHNVSKQPASQSVTRSHETKYHQHIEDNRTIRKISMMSACGSSESTNNVSSDTNQRSEIKKQSKLASNVKISPKTSVQSTSRINDKQKRQFNVDVWKTKLNSIYGKASTLRKKDNSSQMKFKLKKSPRKHVNQDIKTQNNLLNNAEYIPYSQLTLGGVRVSDIEREMSDGPIKNDIPLSPILDKIVSSKENSLNNAAGRSKKKAHLTISDENLLREVIDLENQVNKTLSQAEKNKSHAENSKKESDSSENTSKDNDSYDDDFEAFSSENDGKNNNDDVNSQNKIKSTNSNCNDRTYIKTTNLSLKNTVEIFEFVHLVDTQDSATQSNVLPNLNLQETQTSPRNDTPNLQPIHNDLWPSSSIDPRGEVENLFKLEKDFIKKLIMEEYGEIIEQNLGKPSTSKECKDKDSWRINEVASQKNTQTSPAHVKSVMTSPTKTKTRSTSPLKTTVIGQNNPVTFLHKRRTPNQTDDEKSETEDLSISFNLSSPRFSLRLPQSSREVLTNLQHFSQRPTVSENTREINKKTTESVKPVSSSTSMDATSSEISSLGEVTFKLKRRLRRNRIPTISESSTTSTVSKSSSDFQLGNILPLKSEGEVSIHTAKR